MTPVNAADSVGAGPVRFRAHVIEPDIANGYQTLREKIFANQKKLGVIPPDAKLTSWPDGLPKWDGLSPEEKKLFVRQAEVYAAYLAYTDREIGRVIAEVERLGQRDNTLIIYISGDNGSSAEGSLNGTPNW